MGAEPSSFELGRLTAMSESIEIASLQREPVEGIRISVNDDAWPSLRFNNIAPNVTSAEERDEFIPGRGDLRISLTSACNLRCSYCHNEGQQAPWLQAKTSAMLGNIEKLLEIAGRHGVKSVKFSGGDPGVYPGFFMLMDAIALWRERYPGIRKWGICTNGGPFLAPKKFEALAASRLDNISIGIDSVEPGEPSKPSSPVGVSGKTLVDEFVVPLLRQWNGRSIKFDSVFTGDKQRVLNVIRAARSLGINVSVLEINGVMGTVHAKRSKFLELITETAQEYRLQPRLSLSGPGLRKLPQDAFAGFPDR